MIRFFAILVCAALSTLALLQLHRAELPSREVDSSMSTSGMQACNETIAVPNSTDPIPVRGYIACCNPKMQRSADLLTTLTKYFQVGGRAIDTAPDYGNADYVAKAITLSGVPRDKIWISTKIDTDGFCKSGMEPKAWALAQAGESLRALNRSYVDAMTLHFGPGQAARQKSIAGLVQRCSFSVEQFADMWRGLLEAKERGMVLTVGVCETSRAEIQSLIALTGVKPQLVWTWYHPWVPPEQVAYVEWLKSQGMAVGVYGLFVWKYFKLGKERIQAATVVAQKYNMTWGQLVLQSVVDQGLAYFTPMWHKKYVAEDLACPSQHTTADDWNFLRSAVAVDRCSAAIYQIADQPQMGCVS